MSDRYLELLTAITNTPQDDGPRLAMADFMRSQDPDLARFIELQIARLPRRRADPVRDFPENGEDARLLRKHGDRWSRTIAKYTITHTYDRGFITEVTMDPYMFLEYGEWLLKNAPITCVSLGQSSEGPFPLDELIDSPLLAKLDFLSLVNCGLDDATIGRFAKGPHLDRLLQLDLSMNTIFDKTTWDVLAETPSTRKLLMLASDSSNDPGDQSVVVHYGDYGNKMGWAPRSEHSKALERKYGYLPWLHHENTPMIYFDARWQVEQGLLPLKPAGSPVE